MRWFQGVTPDLLDLESLPLSSRSGGLVNFHFLVVVRHYCCWGVWKKRERRWGWGSCCLLDPAACSCYCCLVLLPARVGKKKEGERRLTLDKKEEKRRDVIKNPGKVISFHPPKIERKTFPKLLGEFPNVECAVEDFCFFMSKKKRTGRSRWVRQWSIPR